MTPIAAILPAWVPPARIIETEWGADTDRFRPDVPPAALDFPCGALDARSAAGTARASGLPARPDTPGTTGTLDPSDVPDAQAAPERRIVIIFVGAFRTWHGVHHLLRAMDQLRERGRDAFHAVLIGDGPERPRAEAEVRARGLANVTLLGPRPHDQIPAYLAAADIGVAPFDLSAHAPLALTFYWSPLKVFEYMAAGLPVVAPDIPRLRAVIRPDEDGLLYHAARPEALADALERLTVPRDAPRWARRRAPRRCSASVGPCIANGSTRRSSSSSAATSSLAWPRPGPGNSSSAWFATPARHGSTRGTCGTFVDLMLVSRCTSC